MVQGWGLEGRGLGLADLGEVMSTQGAPTVLKTVPVVNLQSVVNFSVDVSDFFFLLWEGEGESEAQGREGERFFG